MGYWIHGLAARTAAGWTNYAGARDSVPWAIDALAEGDAGEVLVASLQRIFAFDGAKPHPWPKKASPDFGPIRALHRDAEGTLWIATTRRGLFRARDGVVAQFNRARGLPDDSIQHLVEDAQGRLWLGTSEGVIALAKSELTSAAQDPSRRLRPARYDTADGLHTFSFPPLGQPTAMSGRDGSLWFATMQGVTRLDPAQVPGGEREPPRARVTEVRVDGQPREPDGVVRLPPATRDVTIRFTAPSASNPEKIRFRHRVLGWDDVWRETSLERAVALGRLPAGTNQFEIEARHNEGDWRGTPAVLTLVQQPYFHETWAFRGVVVAAFVGLAWLGYRARVRRLRARVETLLAERSRIGREFHDTLKQGLTGVGLYLDLAARQTADAPDAARATLRTARRLMEHTLEETSRAIWELRSGTLERASLADALTAAACELAAEHGVPVRVECVGPPRPVSEDVAHPLFRITLEAVTNALKHARARAIHVRLEFAPDVLRLEVTDDGVGFDSSAPSAHGVHFGLEGMRERARALGASLEIESRPGAGTHVHLAVALA